MKRLSNIELARVVCLLAVISLHSKVAIEHHPAERFLVDIISRFAVPMFFMISGYFINNKNAFDPLYYKSLSKRVLAPFIVWFLVYLLLYFAGFPGLVFSASTSRILAMPITAGPGHHLWFLPALCIGMTLTLMSISLLGSRTTAVIALALYLIGCFVGLYANLLGRYPPVFYYRNGLFFAPIYLILGYMIRRGELSVKYPVLLAAAGLATSALEGLYATNRFPDGNDMTIGVLLFAVGVFCLVERTRFSSARLNEIGPYVYGAFLSHLLFLLPLLHFVQAPDLPRYAICLLGTFAASLMFSYALKRSPSTAWLA